VICRGRSTVRYPLFLIKKYFFYSKSRVGA